MPFYPKCRNEYREGFTICADRNEFLVNILSEPEQTPTEIDSSSLKYITVFVSDETEEAATVRRILNKNKIPYITRGEEETEFRYVEFLVREDKLGETKSLLKDIIDQESIGMGTESSAPQDLETELKDSVDTFISQPKKEVNLYLFILIIVLISVTFILGIEKSLKYIIAGILIVVFIIRFIHSRKKRL